VFTDPLSSNGYTRHNTLRNNLMPVVFVDVSVTWGEGLRKSIKHLRKKKGTIKLTL
jgi:hypothetical protein